MSFQKTVLIISLIVFSGMLFFIALAMKGLKKSQNFPPEIADCPDYWVRNGNNCIPNSKALYNKGSSDSIVKCASYNNTRKPPSVWAEECDVEWDGITL
jgi:hypothetical protein